MRRKQSWDVVMINVGLAPIIIVEENSASLGHTVTCVCTLIISKQF